MDFGEHFGFEKAQCAKVCIDISIRLTNEHKRNRHHQNHCSILKTHATFFSVLKHICTALNLFTTDAAKLEKPQVWPLF